MEEILRKCRHCGIESPPCPLDTFARQSKCPYGVQNLCKQCASEKSRERHRNNQEHIRTQKKEYERIHVKEISTRKKQYYLNNKEKISARSKKWREDNPERYRAMVRKGMARWMRQNREKYLENHRRTKRHRRAREHNAPGSFTEIEFWVVCINQGWRCTGCDCSINKKTATRDHIVPLSKGGSDFIKNIQAMCLRCNCRKGTRNMAEFENLHDFVISRI